MTVGTRKEYRCQPVRAVRIGGKLYETKKGATTALTRLMAREIVDAIARYRYKMHLANPNGPIKQMSWGDRWTMEKKMRRKRRVKNAASFTVGKWMKT